MRWVKKSTARARYLRRHQTPFEEKLWPHLRAGRLLGVKFRRQHPVGFYFLDFASPFLFLGIELDGAGHFEEQQAKDDLVRDAWLADEGWKILRFRNDDVVHRLSSVLEVIVSEMRRRLDPLSYPSP